MSVVERRFAAAVAAVALIAAGFSGGRLSDEPTTTATVASPHVLTAPPDSAAVVEAQKAACPDTVRVEPQGAPEPPPPTACIATLAPEQLRGAITPLPSIVGSAPADPPNGQYPPSALAGATGCSRGLATNAAAAWNHVAVVVHAHTGYWLQSDGDASCYRTFEQQVELRNYWCNQGKCENAAVPGQSNHGWGLAIDSPSQTVSYIHQYAGALFGQGFGSCSDAPWEGWHIKYCGGYSGPDPGPYGQGGGGGACPTHPVLKKGAKCHGAVRRAQVLLRDQNRGLTRPKADGSFGPATKRAVLQFQVTHHLPADGVIGEKTWQRLRAADVLLKDERYHVNGILWHRHGGVAKPERKSIRRDRDWCGHRAKAIHAYAADHGWKDNHRAARYGVLHRLAGGKHA